MLIFLQNVFCIFTSLHKLKQNGMKKLITLLSLVLFTSYTAKASHAMGGEITVTVDSNNLAHVTLTIYRDANTGTAVLSDSTILVLNSISSPSAPNQTVLLIRTILDTLPSNYPIERHVYMGSIQLTSYGSYEASWSICCRNGAIANATSPASSPLVLITEFTSYSGTQSSTPMFLNVPVVSFPLDTLWTYNPMPYHADGDSLYWSIDVPIANLGASNWGLPGYVPPTSNPNGPFSMNSNTGLITWSPSQIGNYVASILVEEFRAGVKIGEIRRDMQFSVFPDTVAMQFSAPNSISNSNGNPSDNLVAGAPYSLTFELQSGTSNPSLFMTASGEPLELSSSNADFQTQSTSSNKIEGTFTWTPNTSDIRTKPYVINIRAFDGKYSYDFSVELNVSTAVGLDESSIVSNELNIYPNPSKGLVTIKHNLAPENECNIEVLNLQGQIIQQISVDKNSLTQGAVINIDAAPGTYIIRLNGEEHQSKVLLLE